MSKVSRVALHAAIVTVSVMAYAQGCVSDPEVKPGNPDGFVLDGGLGESAAPPSEGITPAAGDGRGFCEKTLGHVLETLEGCCSAGDKASPEYGLASRIFTTLLPVCGDLLESSISKKRVLLHQAEATACYAAYENRFGVGEKCKNVTTTYNDPAGEECRNAYSGVQEAGAPCAGDHECKPGLTCVGQMKAADGVCQTPPAVGAPCGPGRGDGGTLISGLQFANHPACAEGAYCNAGTCAPQGDVGQACTGDNDEMKTCKGSLVCVMGKCAGALSAANGPCESNDDCTSSLYCSVAKGQTTGTCQALKAAGGACTGGYGFATECAGRCAAEGGMEGSCVSFCGSQ